ncbi:MAG: CotH kinase family protein [Candidatus Marinimicrobia bacterium]|nr:CotH kinase family protein [Candidatus Neomarinimicrobiota bacterium]
MDIGFRLRGNTSREAQKKSFKVSFNTFVPGRNFHGVDKLNLNGEHNDPSIVRSKLCWDLYQDVGVTASRSAHTALYINDDYYGLYISVEHIDDEFLSKNFDDDSGNLWKCLWPGDLTYRGDDPANYEPWIDGYRPYELTTNEDTNDFTQLARLISVINNTSDELFADSLDNILYVNEILKYLAMDVLTGNWDDYWFLMNNYYLYHEPDADKFHWIPFDNDNSFGIDWFNIEWSESNPYAFAVMNDGDRPLVERILANDRYRNLYTRYLSFFKEVFISPVWQSNVGDIKTLIFSWAEMDQYRRLDYGFDSDGGMSDFTDSYDDDHYDNQHVKRSIYEYREMRLSSLEGSLNYVPMPPLFYDWSITPEHPVEGDLLTIAASVFDPNGLTFVQVQFTPEGGSQQLFPLQYTPVPETTIVEEADRWMVQIPPVVDVNSAQIRFVAMDASGQIAYFPTSGTITISIESMGESNLHLNELMASNSITIPDNTGEFDDWVELYNMSNIPIILDGLYLSDNPDNLTKWQFPDIQLQLEPEEFLIVWCDEDGSQGPLHASFKLSASGEYVILTAANGVDILDIIEFGAQDMDVSLGRLPDGDGEWAFLPESSPGDYNDMFGCISGDLTCDDAINVLDIVRMVNWILTGYDPDPWELLTADMNSDGSIDVLDVVILVNIILNV